jgi:hypothetical protein
MRQPFTARPMPATFCLIFSAPVRAPCSISALCSAVSRSTGKGLPASNFLLHFCPPVGAAGVEKPLRARFAKIGIERLLRDPLGFALGEPPLRHAGHGAEHGDDGGHGGEPLGPDMHASASAARPQKGDFSAVPRSTRLSGVGTIS